MCDNPVSIDDMYDDVENGVYTNDDLDSSLQGTSILTEGTKYITHSLQDGITFETSEEHKND